MQTEVDIRLSPREASCPDLVLKATAHAAGLDAAAVNDCRVVRRSVDARRKPPVMQLRVRIATGDDKSALPQTPGISLPDLPVDAPVLIIVGAGPAGLFAALAALERGVRPIILERGKDVDSRRIDIASLNRTGIVDSDSNYCFGEGGAGTFSDGKLFTRSKKRGNVGEVLELLVQHGANADILVDAHPHIGSDRLPHIIKAIRHTIIEHGGEVHFGTRADRLLLDCGRSAVRGVMTSDGREHAGAVVLATGHSARDVYRMLHREGVRLDAKGLAIGVRLEHPQHLIDSIQYHSAQGRGRWLPPAEYSFVTQVGGRGVYSFCMCPGGVIVPAVSAPGESVVNGMSASARAGQYANSGMVVELHPGDFPEYSGHGPLEMMELQQDLERKFYAESGSSLNAPAQRMTDFVNSRPSSSLPGTSYAPGIHPARIDSMLPSFIACRLQEGFRHFGAKSRGFLTEEATLIGLESRTSSPVRIPRDPESLEHVHVKGLYPAGEGAGYAGGIVSAAIDGMRAARAYADSLQRRCGRWF